MKRKRTYINLICSILALACNILIGFVLSPFIVKSIGVEANGFVTLANNFVTYAQLIVAALNSLAARFITIEYVNKDYKKANLYYNSVFWGNLIICAVLIIPASFFIAQLDKFVNVPSSIVFDVKLLFAFIFFNFFLTTGFPNWDCGTYVSNRLDRSYIPQVLTSVIRCICVFAMFTVFVPHVWYVGFAATVMTVILLLCNGYNTHKLTPELKISFSPIICSSYAVKELVGSGVWNTISSVGNILLSGLDLIICNIAIGATEMGILSLSKLLPNYMQQLSASIRNAFSPELTINFAKGDKEAVLKDINHAMKMTSMIMTIPIAIIIVVGDKFFALWVPSQDADLLQKLSILAILGYAFTSGTQILYNVFFTVNKVKSNAIAMLISGVASTIITLALVFFTDYDIYAVAGVSTFVNLVRNMIFTLPITAKYLGYRWNQFYPQVVMTIISTVLQIFWGCVIKTKLVYATWIEFGFSVSVLALVGFVINLFLLFNKTERKVLLRKLLEKLKSTIK